MTGTPGGSGDGKPPSTVEQLRADIAHTREELGETVQALAAKADVKARFHQKADEAKARVRGKAEEAKHKVRDSLHVVAARAETAAEQAPEKGRELANRTGQVTRRNPVPIAVAIGAVVLVVVFLRWRRNR